MSKILSFFKNLDIMAVGLAGAIVLVLALSVFSYVLMSANEKSHNFLLVRQAMRNPLSKPL